MKKFRIGLLCMMLSVLYLVSACGSSSGKENIQPPVGGLKFGMSIEEAKNALNDKELTMDIESQIAFKDKVFGKDVSVRLYFYGLPEEKKLSEIVVKLKPGDKVEMAEISEAVGSGFFDKESQNWESGKVSELSEKTLKRMKEFAFKYEFPNESEKSSEKLWNARLDSPLVSVHYNQGEDCSGEPNTVVFNAMYLTDAMIFEDDDAYKKLTESRENTVTTGSVEDSTGETETSEQASDENNDSPYYILSTPDSMTCFYGEKEINLTSENEEFRKIYDMIGKCWNESLEFTSPVMILMTRLEESAAPTDKARIVFHYNEPFAWRSSPKEEETESIVNEYVFFLNWDTEAAVICMDGNWKDRAYFPMIKYHPIRENIIDIVESMSKSK